ALDDRAVAIAGRGVDADAEARIARLVELSGHRAIAAERTGRGHVGGAGRVAHEAGRVAVRTRPVVVDAVVADLAVGDQAIAAERSGQGFGRRARRVAPRAGLVVVVARRAVRGAVVADLVGHGVRVAVTAAHGRAVRVARRAVDAAGVALLAGVDDAVAA